ncbi:MAG: peptidoglycan-associated lipoprotein Pal [Sutterellaceae bacterium]|nr:peptidoglycan-associated lipoprotein Pal [Burkholderiaceae bacterium]MCX7900738.1 peptidoglycan-associated lipoprotein Pal [Burkholderiaceae bacterium]MDW8429853.1 peptidoglycan-associated lipoprotein Pal [Sutterellaceae bacterium]
MRNGKALQRLFAASAVATLAACTSVPLDEKPAPVVEKGAPTPAPAAASAPPPAPDTRAVARVETAPKPVDPLNDPASGLMKREVFFDFDRFEIKPEYIALVEAHGRYLAARKDRKVVIEGNADERGSREYNLALGQKRADAVKARLKLMGATDAQIETISFGEERPRCTQHNEECWWQNRRADIVYR